MGSPGRARKLKAILLGLVLPPANLPLFAIAGLLLRRWHARLGNILALVSCLLLLILAMPIVGGTMLVMLEQGLNLHPPAGTKPGAIVILSAELARSGGEDPGFGPGLLTLQRERAAAALFRRVQLPILVAGGRMRRSDPPLGAVMEQSLRDDFQIPVRWVENRSRDTWQNAEYSAAILRANGIHSVYLVTHAWHMRRALVAFRRFGIDAIPAPVQIDRYPDLSMGDLIPEVRGWQLAYYAVHEWVGYAYYALR